MRRAQSVRHYARPSLALAADDLGILREGDESNEDVLRKQLLEKDRECDKLQMTIQALQEQLAQRPPIEKIQELEMEYKNLELILVGTQRENEKSMAQIEQAKQREKMLERELTRLAGDNWRASLEIPPPAGSLAARSAHQRSNTISSPISFAFARGSPTSSPRPDSIASSIHVQRADSPSPQRSGESEAQRAAATAQIEQIRMLVLGMDQRLDIREERLAKTLEKAENEGKRFESAMAAATAAGVKT
ncbi:hypothetical protein BDN70DRAFT_839935 [Pholiota conissans]|uniref:Uncharacterized protein n=1 Tax=Pholiota conissans TaxID=109636 RepID=A0A9P5YVQ8_9AGAR|nr:hypothetical protein BDN70DRAFT_839935 [Pholiota conissans]